MKFNVKFSLLCFRFFCIQSKKPLLSPTLQTQAFQKCYSVGKSCPTLCDLKDWSMAGFSVLHLPEFAQIHVHWVSDAIYNFILCHPLLLLPSIFPSIRVFSKESALCIRWPNYWSFSFSISPLNECSGFISFRIDWFDLLAVQGTLKESSPALQFESINSVVLSLLYGPTLTSIHDYWKNHSFDYMDLCQQVDVSAFYYAV